MNEIYLWIAVLFFSVLVLVKSSDLLTSSAEKIGLLLKIPAFIIGVTIVAIGTSLPELISSIIAVADGSSEIVLANVLGSNITNIFLVLGVAAIFAKKLELSYELLHVDLPLFIGATFLLLLAVIDGEYSFFDAILSLAGVGVYILYSISAKHPEDTKVAKSHLEMEHKKVKWNYMIFVQIVISAIFLYSSAKFTIDAVVNIAEILKVATEIVAITAIALGTSLPELAVALQAARRGNSEIVVGSILGSSIMNSLGVMAIASFFGELVIREYILVAALPIMLIAAVMYFFITQEKQITKWEGWLLIIFYLFFLENMINLG